jgi:hypothetical protein
MRNIKCVIMPVKIGTNEIVTKDLKKNLEAISGKRSGDSQRRHLCLEDNIQNRKYCNLKLEPWAVKITAGLREEVQGRKD